MINKNKALQIAYVIGDYPVNAMAFRGRYKNKVPIIDYNTNDVIAKNYYSSYQYEPSNQGNYLNLIPIE